MREDTSAVPGSRKAAILMILLGQEVAGKLLHQLPSHAASAIIAEVARLGVIDPASADNVLEDYFMEALRPEEHRGGSDIARQLLASAGLSEDPQAPIPGITPDPTEELLKPLLDTSPELLASVLAEEHGQTAALVLLQLQPRKAAQVLKGMPDEVRAEVIARMTSLGRVRGEILAEVIGGLEDRLADPNTAAAEEGPADGLERTAAVLQAMARGDVRLLLEGLERHDAERAAQLREMVFTFDSLVLADDRGIQELLRLVETKTIALALKGVEEQLLEKFVSNLSERAASMLKEEIEFLGTIRPADQEAAQQEITQKALELESDDKLVFRDPDEEGES